jgi:hypothetical protein
MMRLLLACALLVSACGDDHMGGPDAGGPDAAVTPDACANCRSYSLASTGLQAIPGQPQLFQMGTANLADDADVVSIHQDFYGVPWDEFEANQPPPAEWAAKMDSLAQQSAGMPVFLSLQLVGGTGRQYLADKTLVVNGNLGTTANWSVQCYDFASMADGASKKQAYVRYVDYMVRKFQPRWVNVAIEMNLFMPCGAAWNGLRDAANAAYDAAKAARPDVIAFPSIQIDMLYGYNNCAAPMTRDQCFEANYARLAGLHRDRFAISTYPYLLDAVKTVPNLPADWFTRAADRGGERIVIAETGWDATNAVGRLQTTCFTALMSSPDDQTAYLSRLLDDAQAHNMDLVTWWSNRDLIPAQVMTDCPCTFDATWCNIVDAFRQTGGTDEMAQFYAEMTLKIWGTMGVRTYDGTQRATTYARWQQARALPIAQ